MPRMTRFQSHFRDFFSRNYRGTTGGPTSQ
ncbi:hypothetical protein NC652_016512 [Populus alba x Populus x berolinensis]|nr:hypothetical protein NC652_016512 [Populus alba x Populus x berolinensis]